MSAGPSLAPQPHRAMTTASPAKLRDGSWGARVSGRASEGDTITIETRAGKKWDATVSRVLWSGADRRTGKAVSLVATNSSGSATSGRARNTSRRSRGCDECADGEYDGTRCCVCGTDYS